MLRQAFHGACLGQTWQAFEEAVAVAQQSQQEPLDDMVLADDRRLHAALQFKDSFVRTHVSSVSEIPTPMQVVMSRPCILYGTLSAPRYDFRRMSMSYVNRYEARVLWDLERTAIRPKSHICTTLIVGQKDMRARRVDRVPGGTSLLRLLLDKASHCIDVQLKVL
jgi:hypothetical protein